MTRGPTNESDDLLPEGEAQRQVDLLRQLYRRAPEAAPDPKSRRPERWPLPASHALIAWDQRLQAVAVGYLLDEDVPDWTRPYECTGGASEVRRRYLAGRDLWVEILLDYYQLTYVDGLDPQVVHRALLNVQEFHDALASRGMGPDKGEPGFTGELGYGRLVSSERLNVHRFWHSEHVRSAQPAGAQDHQEGLA